MNKIVVAGGCFWGVESYFKKVPGILSTSVGYANGSTTSPTYEDVCRRNTGHVEACEVVYDDEVISLERLLKFFFKIIDPTSLNKQGNDKGIQYRTGIYYKDSNDAKVIFKFMEDIAYKYEKPIVVEVVPLENYFLAEDYHQDYLTKNPNGYCHIDVDKALSS